MKYSVITFGCRVNQADSWGFEEQLLAAGAAPDAPEAADIVVVNTCSVTATADQGARQTIRRIARANPSARIVVTGCYATRSPDDLRSLPNVSCVVPNDDKPRLLTVLTQAEIAEHADESRVSAPWPSTAVNVGTAERFGDGEGSCGAAIEPGVAGRTAFTLRVQTGCSEPCSYCIIPSTRGTPRSVSIADVVREVNRVAASGFKEIALTGVHLGSYGRDLTPSASLIDLLRAVDNACSAKVPAEQCSAKASAERCAGPLRSELLFRISSLEPMDCSREIVDLVEGSTRFAPHFHLPLQHASNRVLRAMCRPYTIADYASLVTDIRARLPHASIGSDVIVGFPGETVGDFDHLAEYLERSPLTHIHVFPYSERPGTVASAMRDKVPGSIVRERARRIRVIGQRLVGRFRESQLGTVHQALTLDDGTIAVTGNYLKVRIPRGRERNEWIRLRIGGTASDLVGEIL
jgi:threonylcarbamoyladenosine tRNA methylthiotransferase MtaB